jgi:hypothetical protein
MFEKYYGLTVVFSTRWRAIALQQYKPENGSYCPKMFGSPLCAKTQQQTNAEARSLSNSDGRSGGG